MSDDHDELRDLLHGSSRTPRPRTASARPPRPWSRGGARHGRWIGRSGCCRRTPSRSSAWVPAADGAVSPSP